MSLDANKINLLSGMFTSPLIESLLACSTAMGGITALYSTVLTLHRNGLNQECTHLLQLLSAAAAVPFPEELKQLTANSDLAACFVDEFLKDAEDLLRDFDIVPIHSLASQ